MKLHYLCVKCEEYWPLSENPVHFDWHNQTRHQLCWMHVIDWHNQTRHQLCWMHVITVYLSYTVNHNVLHCAGPDWHNGVMLTSQVSYTGLIPFPSNWGSLHASDKRAQATMDPPWLETHGQSHPESKTEETSGPTKCTSLQ